MNIPSYNTEQDNSNKISTKRIPKWILPAIAVLIIIGIAVGAFMLYQNSNSNNNGGTASCALGATGINPIACRRDHF